MKSRQYTPEECFIYGQQLARVISDEYYQKHGHVIVGDSIIHHYLLLFAIPFFEDECMKAFLAGAALDDLPDLLDDVFPENKFVKGISNGIREYRGENKRHS